MLRQVILPIRRRQDVWGTAVIPTASSSRLATPSRELFMRIEQWFSTSDFGSNLEVDESSSEDRAADPLKVLYQRRKRENERKQQNNERHQRGSNKNGEFNNRNRQHSNNGDRRFHKKGNEHKNFANSEGRSKVKRSGNNWNGNKQKYDGNNNNQFNQRRRKDNSFDQRQNNRKGGKQHHRHNQNQRDSGHNSRNKNQSDNRLSDLIAQLRKNANTPNRPAGAPGNNTRSQRSPDTPSQSSWRERFTRSQSFSESDSGLRGEGDPLPPFPRPFIPRPPVGRNQDERGGHGSARYQKQTKRPVRQRVDRDGLQFLEGRRGGSKSPAPVEHNTEEVTRVVTLPGGAYANMTLTEASSLFRIKMDDIEEKLRFLDVQLPIESKSDEEAKLDVDTLELLAIEFGIETIRGEEDIVVDSEELLMQQRRADEDVTFPPRPPVVCIMGHVDHGKTTLMDALRRRALEQLNPKASKSKGKKKKGKKNSKNDHASKDVAGTEAGGITQVVSAFQVDVEGQDNKVTFLDTPGHAAFKSMRQSGSHAADVIVLVIAADDGVSEQTKEILEFYKSIVSGSDGGISMVVALNKIDKPGIDIDEAQMRIENQLLEEGILCEGMPGNSEYGSPVQMIPTSGLTGLGLDDLMEGLILQSEVMDLRADDTAHAEGIVMDARIEKGLGVVADCIIRWGSIEKGNIIVSGSQSSSVRMLKDVNDKMLKQGLPSQPVRIVGFKSLPKAGDPILCVESEEIADQMVEQRSALNAEAESQGSTPRDVELHINGMRSRDTARASKVQKLAGLDTMQDETIRIPIIIKADADGSLSALRDSMVNLGVESSHDAVIVDPIQEGIGDITPTDIQMAKESDACIFAFGLKRVDQNMLNMAEAEGVKICNNDIIYSLLDEAKETLGRYLPPQPVEHIHGRALVQAIFNIGTESGDEKVAGLKVAEGNLYKSQAPVGSNDIACHFRVLRNGEQVSPEGEVVSATSLRRFKELVESVRHGDECGLGLTGFSDFEEGDEIECYSIEMKSGTL